MATRSTLATEISTRLGDAANAIWPLAEVKSYVDYSIKSLYPSFYLRKVGTTSVAAGLVQTAPAGAKNLYLIGHNRQGTVRVRNLRGWAEGDGTAFIPKQLDAGDSLVWAWTEGWDAPAADGTALTIPFQAEEVIVIRSQIAALERLLSDRVSAEKYFALQVRQSVTEEDLATSIDALQGSLRDRLANVLPLPEVVR